MAKGSAGRGRGYDAAVYLDLYAGPGIVEIKRTGDRVAGSPIAATSVEVPFDYSIFVEADSERSRTLRWRLSLHLPEEKFTVIEDNCDACIDEVTHFIEERSINPIILAFIDPEGMKASWKTVEVLSRNFPNLHFIINNTTPGPDATRLVAGKFASIGMPNDRPVFRDFFGPVVQLTIQEAIEQNHARESYSETVAKVLGEQIGPAIQIRESPNFVASRIYRFARSDLHSSRWVRGFNILHDNVSRIDSWAVLSFLDVLKGRQKILLKETRAHSPSKTRNEMSLRRTS